MSISEKSNESGNSVSGTGSAIERDTEESKNKTVMEEKEVKNSEENKETDNVVIAEKEVANEVPVNEQNEVTEVKEPEPVENQVSETSENPAKTTVSITTETEDSATEEIKEENPSNLSETPLQSTEGQEEDKDHQDHEEDEDHEEADYSHFSKKELVEEIKKLAHDENILKADRTAQNLKVYFEEIHKKEREDALAKFTEEGGEEDGFEYRNDELDNRFEANLRLIHDNKVNFLRQQEQQKDHNLKKKEEVLEKLREFVDSEETNISFNQFKEIQDEWKSIGPIPGAHVKTLWANYHALIDRFYDNRSIYFELKELDRKKNLETKLELCEKAEKLKEVENLKDAISELNELHNEFKHIGPVPRENQEELWERFKAASDAIYERRKGFVENLKKELEENLVKKEALCEKVKEYTLFNSDRIKEWNQKTTEILQLQKEWEKIGGLPRNKAKDVNKAFWGAFKDFFNNKNHFFRELDKAREGNLKFKEELIRKAEALKESDDLENTANEIKKLQQQWKEAGPVPEKYREKSYKEFKAACDHFFDRKRGQQAESEKEFEHNLKLKEELCKKLDELAGTEEGDLNKLDDIKQEFYKIGFVPKKAINKIKKRFESSIENFINSIEDLSEDEKENVLIKDEIDRLKLLPGNQNRLARKEQEIRKEIQSLENDISLWKNNLEFFANSKTADKLRDEFSDKIETAEENVRTLKHQLRILRANKE